MSPTARVLTKVASIAAMWLLSVSVGEAATHRAPRKARAKRVCDPQTLAQKLPRKPISYGGPVMPPSQRALVGLIDPMAHIRRGAGRLERDDSDQAIQNDASIAPTVPAQLPRLLALWVCEDPFAPQLLSAALPPRSPRGPPASA